MQNRQNQQINKVEDSRELSPETWQGYLILSAIGGLLIVGGIFVGGLVIPSLVVSKPILFMLSIFVSSPALVQGGLMGFLVGGLVTSGIIFKTVSASPGSCLWGLKKLVYPEHTRQMNLELAPADAPTRAGNSTPTARASGAPQKGTVNAEEAYVSKGKQLAYNGGGRPSKALTSLMVDNVL